MIKRANSATARTMQATVGLVLTVALSAVAANATLAQPADAVIATKGDLQVYRTEAQSAAYFATPEQIERLRTDPTQWMPIAEEALTIKEWLRSGVRKALTAEELAAVEYRSRLADVRAGVDALAQRDVARLRADIRALEARARDLWLVDDGKYFTPTTAKVNLVFIDAHKRGLKDATVRFQQIVRRVKRGDKFDRVAADLGDIVPGQKALLPVPMSIELRGIEGAARRAIFRDLKIGQLSSPIPTPEGWVVAQVLDIKKQERRPFDEIKQTIMEDILLETSATARMAVMARLGEPAVKYSPSILPDPAKDRDARAAATAAAQLAQEMKVRSMTNADAEKRLKELLELAKRSEAESNSTPNNQKTGAP